MTKPVQRWRPIELMPAFKYAVGSAAEATREQAENMRLAIRQHDLISRVELARMHVVYEDTALYVQMCREQLRQWHDESTTPEQATMLERLDAIVKQWDDDTRTIVDAVNALLHQV
jgi:Tfp pilus assembly protein FimT